MQRHIYYMGLAGRAAVFFTRNTLEKWKNVREIAIKYAKGGKFLCFDKQFYFPDLKCRTLSMK